jgi:hypothetical protein
MSANQPKNPAGTPSGGQWAPSHHAESPITLHAGREDADSARRLGRPIKRALHDNDAFSILDSHPVTYGSDFGQGGCRVAAVAIAKVLPGSEVHAIKLAGSDEPQHFVVAYRGLYLDRDGAQTKQRLLATASRDWFVDQSRLSVGPVTPEEIEDAEAPDPANPATGKRLSDELAVLLAPAVGTALGELGPMGPDGQIGPRTEAGQGGRKGHSNMSHWEHTAVLKQRSRKARRSADRRAERGAIS